MRDSILTSIKKLLGIAEEDCTFDMDIMIHINTVLMVLRQMGVGPAFEVVDAAQSWTDYLGEDGITQFSAIRSYVYLKVRLLFDPPSGSVLESTNNLIKELEYRLYADAHWPTWPQPETTNTY